MEKIGDRQDEDLKFPIQTAIRCPKAATRLSSLKNATNNSTTNFSQTQEEEKIELLKIEWVKEKLRFKKLRVWVAISLLSYVMIFLISLKEFFFLFSFS